MTTISLITNQFDERKIQYNANTFKEIIYSVIQETKNYIIIESILKSKDLVSTLPPSPDQSNNESQKEFGVHYSHCGFQINNSIECSGDNSDEEELDKHQQEIEEASYDLIDNIKSIIDKSNRNKESMKELYYALEQYYNSIYA